MSGQQRHTGQQECIYQVLNSNSCQLARGMQETNRCLLGRHFIWAVKRKIVRQIKILRGYLVLFEILMQLMQKEKGNKHLVIER